MLTMWFMRVWHSCLGQKGVDKSSKSAIIYTVTEHITGVTICRTVTKVYK